MATASETAGIAFGSNPLAEGAFESSEIAGIAFGSVALATQFFEASETAGIGFGSAENAALQAIASESSGIAFGSTPFTALVGTASESSGIALGSVAQATLDALASETAGIAFGSIATISNILASESSGIGFGSVAGSVLTALASESAGIAFGSVETAEGVFAASASSGIAFGSIALAVFTPITPVLVGKYQPEHARALIDLTNAGTSVIFTNENPSYTFNPGISGLSATTVDGKAIETSGRPFRYEGSTLVVTEDPTLIFAPTAYGNFPDIGDHVIWRGLDHIVADIELLAPDAVTILAFIRISLQDSGVQSIPGTEFLPDHARALTQIKDAGRPVTFLEDNRVYTFETGLSTISQTAIEGHAIRTGGTKKMYELLGLVERDAVTLLFAGNTFGEFPNTGMRVDWGSIDYTVRWTQRIAPDGGTIISRVVVSR